MRQFILVGLYLIFLFCTVIYLWNAYQAYNDLSRFDFLAIGLCSLLFSMIVNSTKREKQDGENITK